MRHMCFVENYSDRKIEVAIECNATRKNNVLKTDYTVHMIENGEYDREHYSVKVIPIKEQE